MPQLRTHLLPALVEPGELAGAAVVVIDVLRATTTIVHALAAGARAVMPCLEVDEAQRLAARFSPGEAVLGGERQGLRIEGFDLGNSPQEYTPQAVGGRTVVFTTTNGTRALMACRQARRVLIGAFVNCRAVAAALAHEPAVHLVCAGTRGQITREDVLLAGALAQRLTAGGGASCWELNDPARLALDAWRIVLPQTHEPQGLAGVLADTQGGRNLRAEGFAADIPVAAALDRFDLVPQLDPRRMAVS